MASTATPEGPAPKRSDTVANRQRLLHAAREAFAEIGANAEVKDIAERAGVGVGTIYRHFASKEDLLRGVIAEAMADFHQEMAGLADLEDPIEAIRRFIGGVLDATETYGWLFDAILGGTLPDAVREGLDNHEAESQLVAVLARGIEAGVLDPNLDVPIAKNMLIGFAVTWKYGELIQTMTLDEAVERTLRLFLRGAAAQ